MRISLFFAGLESGWFCDVWGVTESSSSMCGFGQLFGSMMAVTIEVLVGGTILNWLWGNWGMAKYRAKEKLRGNRK